MAKKKTTKKKITGVATAKTPAQASAEMSKKKSVATKKSKPKLAAKSSRAPECKAVRAELVDDGEVNEHEPANQVHALKRTDDHAQEFDHESDHELTDGTEDGIRFDQDSAEEALDPLEELDLTDSEDEVVDPSTRAKRPRSMANRGMGSRGSLTSKSSAKSTSNSLLPAEAQRSLTSSDPLAMYLNEIRRYKVLSREEEQALAKKYFESKDPEAAQDLVKANLRFVVKVASNYSKFGAKMIDLIQEGNVGLMHAVREYNPYKGARLITYAVWWIRGYIQEYLMRQYSMVRIGTTQNQRKLFYQLQKEKEALDAMGIEPSAALIGSRLGIPENEVQDMTQRMSGRDLSLDKPIDGDSGASLGDLQKDNHDIPLDERMARSEQLEILKEKIDAIRPDLSARELIILDERILNDEPLTLQEIGEKYGITREAVRQMEVRVMKKIKTKMEAE